MFTENTSKNFRHAAKWLGRSAASALSILFFLILFASGLVYALSFPSSAPTGQVAGGTFASYFRNMFATGNRCPNGKAVQYFQSDGTPHCAEAGGVIIPAQSQNYSYNQLVALGYKSGSYNGVGAASFTIPMGTSANTRFVIMNTIAQADMGVNFSGFAASITVNGKTCSTDQSSGSNGTNIRLSSECVFKIDPNTNPTVVVQHWGTTDLNLNVDDPNAPMVTYVTMSY